LRLENTEVCCLITGGEEAGLRGLLAYSEQHKEELSSIETIFIALETMREIDQLKSIKIGQNGLVKNSEAIGKLLNEAGKNCGKTIPKSYLPYGATDADGFCRNKIRACGFCGVDRNPQLYYHTRHDTWDNISEECLQLSLEICLEATRLYDENDGIIKYENMIDSIG
jgi:Zn-dependent M28 family amino/carboxypeptidase